jgi:alkanesulfonate monooxygenase SsuD/methylene tetrahydromethanopterin reductase-like flavin-dependent oxidoreductase (luciferase family)
VATPQSVDSLECWTLMSALARETSRLRFGTLVVCNGYRHPPLLAKMAATLDHVADGRLEFGLGAGWYEQEYQAYGFRSRRSANGSGGSRRRCRSARWRDERAFRRALLSGRRRLVQSEAVQKPWPPIMIGGGGERCCCGWSRNTPIAGTSVAASTRSATRSRSSTATAPPSAGTPQRSSEAGSAT